MCNGSAASLLVLADSTKALVVLEHADWERPHRILAAFGDVEVRTVRPLAGEALPRHEDVAGIVAMGGPMGADDDARHPALAEERRWLADAVERELPVLGVCLGSQLLAMALGGAVSRGERPEIGFSPVEILAETDPLAGPLAPRTTVLHWHGDVIEPPPGATPLARSEQTELQGFRLGTAWGLLFHAEADERLVEQWLAVPQMASEARAALGPDAAGIIRRAAVEHSPNLLARSAASFRAFADLLPLD